MDTRVLSLYIYYTNGNNINTYITLYSYIVDWREVYVYIYQRYLYFTNWMDNNYIHIYNMSYNHYMSVIIFNKQYYE